MVVEVPSSAKPGETFQVQLPKAPPAEAPVATTMGATPPPIAPPLQTVQTVQQPPVAVVQAAQPVPQPVQHAQPMVPPPSYAVFGHTPVMTQCPKCHNVGITRVEKTSGLFAWGSCVGLACFGCIWGCCLIPFCVDAFKDTKHYCTSCCECVLTLVSQVRTAAISSPRSPFLAKEVPSLRVHRTCDGLLLFVGFGAMRCCCVVAAGKSCADPFTIISSSHTASVSSRNFT